MALQSQAMQQAGLNPLDLIGDDQLAEKYGNDPHLQAALVCDPGERVLDIKFGASKLVGQGMHGEGGG